MNEREALAAMVPPGARRPGKYMEGVVQILATRACNKACYGCTQGSNFRTAADHMPPEHFAAACASMAGYFGVVGMFGGNPAMHPQFPLLCTIMRGSGLPHLGIWCNDPLTEVNAKAMRATFDPAISNLNVHLDRGAYARFRQWWPESRPFGLTEDSRHSPPYVAMEDVVADESERWRLISSCDINRHWSAMVGMFRGSLCAWFCEVAGAQAALHQDNCDYPDTGLPVVEGWWRLPMEAFADQVRAHCHRCGIPLRIRGELSQAYDGKEQLSMAHSFLRPKNASRRIELVVSVPDGRVSKATDYLGNAKL